VNLKKTPGANRKDRYIAKVIEWVPVAVVLMILVTGGLLAVYRRADDTQRIPPVVEQQPSLSPHVAQEPPANVNANRDNRPQKKGKSKRPSKLPNLADRPMFYE
jgi:hypothetical protein